MGRYARLGVGRGFDCEKGGGWWCFRLLGRGGVTGKVGDHSGREGGLGELQIRSRDMEWLKMDSALGLAFIVCATGRQQRVTPLPSGWRCGAVVVGWCLVRRGVIELVVSQTVVDLLGAPRLARFRVESGLVCHDLGQGRVRGAAVTV